jgi:hypothetical protein
LPLFAFALLAACGGPSEKPAHSSNDGVPANSLSEARLAGEPKPAATASSQTTASDPTQPYIQKVGEEPLVPAEKPDDKKKPSKTGDKVTKQECEAAFDRYITLEIETNPKLRGVGPEVIAQAKEMARGKDSADCNATKSQYRCAMAATSTAGWQRCMK